MFSQPQKLLSKWSQPKCHFMSTMLSHVAAEAKHSLAVELPQETHPLSNKKILQEGVASQVSFYRRELPPNLVSFTSDEGKAIFREALAEGYMESYFSLVGNFATQTEPACKSSHHEESFYINYDYIT
jgi:hypothetical protein